MRLTPGPPPPAIPLAALLLLGPVIRAVMIGAVAIGALAIGARPAVAAPLDLYRVAGVPVDATAGSAVAAREQAIAGGERDGLRQLLRRLTLPEDEARLPRAEGLKIDDLVQSFEVASEKVGPTRYVAALNVSYVPDQVRALLRRAGVPFLERRPEPVLLVPVLLTDAGPDLWGEANPWRAAWNAGVPSPLVELRLPLGDAGDVAMVPVDAVTANDPALLAALAQRYQTQSVDLALARLQAPAAGGADTVMLEVRPGDAAAADQPLLRETVTGQPGETEAALLARAAGHAVTAIELAQKRRLIVRDDQLASVQVGVPLADLSSWVQIKRALGAVPEVRSVRVDSFARAEATVTVAYAGDLSGLASAMQRAGLALAEEEGQWRLRAAGGPVPYQGPSSASPATP